MASLTALRERRWPPAPTTPARQAVTAALTSGTWTEGRYTHAVETEMRELTGAPYAVAFQSCTAALHAALIAHGCRYATPLHTPGFGFAGTLTGASHIGARFIYHDVDPQTGNSVDPMQAPGHLVLTPDLHGVPHTLDRAEVITDACQSLGTLREGRHVGAVGTHCWSFSATKLVAAPDGGAVTTDDQQIAWVLQQLRDYGAEPGRERANALVTRPGHNWRPSELSMALVAEQLRELPAVAVRARAVGAQLQATLADTGLWHQQTPPGTEPAWHKIRTGHRGGDPRALRRALSEAGVPTHDWGRLTLPEHPMFFPVRDAHQPPTVAAWLADNTFCLGTESCPPWTWTTGETDLVCATIEMIMESL